VLVSDGIEEWSTDMNLLHHPFIRREGEKERRREGEKERRSEITLPKHLSPPFLSS